MGKKRGKYRRWLNESGVSIPESTLRSRRKKLKIQTNFESSESTSDEVERSIKDYEITKPDFLNENLPNEPESVTNYNIRVNNISEPDENEYEVSGKVADDESNVNNMMKNRIDREWNGNDLLGEDNCFILSNREEDNVSDDANSLNSQRIFENVLQGDIDSEDDPQERDVLYAGCNIIFEESKALIKTYCNRHHLTDVGINDLLQLIDCHLPSPLYKTKYHLFKDDKNKENCKLRFICPECSSLLEDNKSNILNCKDCTRVYDKHTLRACKSYFIQIPLKPQIEDFVNSDKYNIIIQKNNPKPECLTDITSGMYYQNLRKNNIIKQNDLTLQFNTDGIILFKSSALSLWPIQVSINELPYLERRKHMMLVGLWYGKDKPKMNTFLKPIVEEFIDLHQNGIDRFTDEGPNNIKIHTIACSVDSVARPTVINSTQYNGKHGCSFCYHEGEAIAVGRGHTRVYPGDLGEIRTMEKHYAHAKEAEELNSAVKGVKGFSIVSLIPFFSIIDSFLPDYLHCVLLGVIKTFTDAWFNSIYHNKSWYIGIHIKAIEVKLLQIKPPCELSRTPRKLYDRNLWKAHEWKNFACYYSLICLYSYLPKKYINHWFTLIYSIRVFLSSKITKAELEKATKSLRYFVLNIELLYGKEFCKFNTHLLLHISRAVKLFGPLWDSSTFPYENYNGTLAKMFKNSQSVPEEICKSFNRFRNVEHESIKIFSKPNCPDNLKTLYVKWLSNVKMSQNCIEHCMSLRILGNFKIYDLSIIEKTVIEELLGENINQESKLYYRFILKNVLWHGGDNNYLEKRNNSCAELIDNTVVFIKSITRVVTIDGDERYVILANAYNLIGEAEKIAKNSKLKIDSAEMFKIYRLTKNILAFYPNDIQKKLICIPHEDNFCLTTLVNNIEKD